MSLAVQFRYENKILSFSSNYLNNLREKLSKTDQSLSLWARQDLRYKLFKKAKPPIGVNTGPKEEYTEYSLLLNETNKQSHFIPIRSLIYRAAKALKEIKPCWMMSPTAVSQYIADEKVTFDLCILDEASQMTPENAIPALARCKQIIIVGDTNQLPPTHFFKKNVLAEYISNDEESEADLLEESILEMAIDKFSPKRQLLWHYRSRHSGLINFCNHLIYDDKLTVYPSPTEQNPDMGVTLVKTYGEYKSSLNPIEASLMARWALLHMKNDPNRSLGLVTFNEKQRNYISELMDIAIEENDYALEYVNKWKIINDGLESFFIKNLENVQGDERDVIFIGTVYGPEKKDGVVAQRFGPITGWAGRRRLNVLFSRAKQKIVTFTSMSPTDIRANENDQTGTAMLKQWLIYSEMGGSNQVFKKNFETSDLEPSLEKFVISRVEDQVFMVDRNVGTEGYALDLAVKNAYYPLGYLIGLEGDGRSYYHNVSVRDRDCLRPKVLTGLGWELFRIWTTAWYTDPLGELKQLNALLENRVAKANIIVKRIAVGDLVTIKFLDEPQIIKEILISNSHTNLNDKFCWHNSPLGKALIGQEEKDEVQIKINNTIRFVLIESIIKGVGLELNEQTIKVFPEIFLPPSASLYKRTYDNENDNIELLIDDEKLETVDDTENDDIYEDDF
jgi:very-short-patch-repair endonuclease